MSFKSVLPAVGLLSFLVMSACNQTTISGFGEISRPVEPFPITAVTLLEGPFKHATELDKRTLLSYESNRLLARFRLQAGLEPKGASYGGWEAESLAGHTLGHYLSACALMYQTSGDQQFKDRVDYIVSELADVQEANGDGYIGAFDNGKKIFEEEVARGEIRSQSFNLNGIWSPFYTHHKVMAGLRDAFRLTGNDQALEVESKFADWIGSIVLPLNNEELQDMLNCEFGGIQETLVDLFADTGDQKYLEIAQRFHHEAVIDPLIEGRDILPGIHGNTQIPKLIASARLYEIEEKDEERSAAEFFWDRVVHHHSYVTGGHGNHEYFGQPDQLRSRLSNETTETCNVYNMLKLSRHLFLWKPRADVADFYERALFNHILSSQHPETGQVIYNLSLEMGGYKEYQDPEWFTCCVGSGMETHAKYGANIYYHNDEELFVSQYLASEVKWEEKKLKLIQETDYPDQSTTRFTFELEEPVQFTFYVRYPSWAEKGIHIAINGQKQPVDATPGSFLALIREWSNGDLVEVELPFSLHLESMPDDSNRIALLYGPLVLAGDLGAVDAEKANTADFVPVLITRDRSPATWLETVEGEINTFRTKGVGYPREVTLKPFYKTHDRRYSVYFDLYTEESYQKFLAEEEAKVVARQKLEEATYDRFQPGDSLDEIEHHLQGEDLNIMRDFKGRDARGAERGGWLSFEMSLPPEVGELVIEYWGGFTGGKTFDILIDNTKIATENISGKKDGEFINVSYSIPAELSANKSKITIRFDPHDGSRAGPFFYARTVANQ
ncbi:MAG: glycoside hydrolase family 127 protein [Saprospiraceae bacterium]|nr:glycoside hydrolase family 127 protein [Saprospiraceae bacterium]